MSATFSPFQPAAGAVAEGSLVLLVEDEDYIADLMLLVLSRAGFSCRRARDGAEALRLASEAERDIALAMVDLCLPDMVGDELCRQLRALHPGLPVLLTSGSDLDGFQHLLEAGGPTAMLGKPYRPTDLIQQVRAMLPRAA